MKYKLKKIMAVILTFSLCLGSLPVNTFAATEGTVSKNSAAVESADTKTAEIDSLDAVEDLDSDGETTEQKTEQETEQTTEAESGQEKTTGEISSDTSQESTESVDAGLDSQTPSEADLVDEEQSDEEEASEEEIMALDSGETIDSITINSVDALLDLAEKDASSYQNATIKIAPSGEELNFAGTTFQGLGSKSYPFQGKMEFSGNVDEYITLDCPLFQYLSQNAVIGSLNLTAANNMTTALLAEHYVKSESGTAGDISVQINAQSTSEDNTTKVYSTFGGIIGTMEEGSALNLTVTNQIAEGYSKVTGSGNRGLFCNTMEEGATLTIAEYTGETQYSVTSSDGNAGALVGYMKGATLIIEPEFSYAGSVSGKKAAGGLVGCTEKGTKTDATIHCKENYTVSENATLLSEGDTGTAGGLLGTGENTVIQAEAGNKIRIDGASIKGKYASGGLAGSCIFSDDTDTTWDFSDFEVKNLSFTTGTYAGGAFGVLSNTSTEQKLQLTGIESSISSTGKGCTNFGGLIGLYSAKNLAATLAIDKVEITSSVTKSNTAYGGLIGEVGSGSSSYLTIDNVVVNTTSKEYCTYFGGLVAVSNGGSMFNVGSVQVSGTFAGTVSDSKLVYGGLIGALTNGVLRLHGTTDLSGISIGAVSPKFGQLVGTRTSALIYAMGDGTNGLDDSDGSDTGWTFVRDGSGSSISDVGTWGEVVRIDGERLKESQVTENGAADTKNLLVFNTKSHTVTISGFSAYDSTRGHIYNVQNFAAIALSYQCTGGSGALQFAVTVMEMAWWIYLDNDIDLTGTGITGFLRDDGSLGYFSGMLDGQNHTIKVAVGETYGQLAGNKPVGDTEGCGQIYNHQYLGLFAKTQSMRNGIKNLTVDGTITFGNTGCTAANSMTIYCGGVTAFQNGNEAIFTNVTSSVAISYKNGTVTSKMPDVYMGGMLAYAYSGATLTFTDCVWDGSFTNECTAWNYYLSGYVGCLADYEKDGSITVKNSKIQGSIRATQVTNNAKMGGLLASTANNGNGKITITATNLTIDGFQMENSSTGTSGGFLGYDWHNVDFNVDGLTIKGSTLKAENSGFGGLVYQASGYWKVHGSGISFTGTNAITGKSVNDTPSALLVCRGYDYRSGGYALYMEIGKDAYQVAGTTELNLSSGSGTYFDEIVGISIQEAGNGVVSIATGSSLPKIDQSDCNTYQKQLSKDYKNPHTRYYYDLDTYRLQNNSVWADNTIESGVELLLWSVGQYCETNLSAYFTTSRDASVTMKGTLDLTGLSYYPVDYTGAVTMKDVTLTFDYQTIEERETSVSNKPLSSKESQHYEMQDGLFLTLTSSTDTAASISIQGTSGLTLCGTIGQLDASQYSGGSGALVCGKANGQLDGTTQRTFSFGVDASAKILLKDLKVYSTSGLDDYAPLLINEVGSYSSLSLVNVSTTGYAEKTKAATSLLGMVGSEEDTNIVLLFENMDLDGRTESSVFTRASFMESFSYSTTDMASSGTYNFDKDSTFTYGKEISNGVNGNGTTGRNPYNTDEETGQVWYHNTYGTTTYVTDESTSAVSGNGFFTDDYLPYVRVPEGGSNGSTAWKHEIDVNQMVIDITKGCGTYDDPYIIDTDGQLETLATFLSTGSIAGWKINICYEIASNSGSVSLATHSKHYSYTSAYTWNTAEKSDASLTSAQARTYLRNAYYMVTEDITLKSTFYGLGGSDPSASVFSGVIIGKKADGTAPTIKISTHTNKSHSYFGGLIAYSGGSVVKNLMLDYSGTEEDSNASGASLTLTAKAPSQSREDQAFFGGVIGYVVGGDNIIDGVNVTGLDQFSLTILGTDKQEDGTNAELTPVGAYVGLVGGNTESGGGVIFRNITSKGFSGGKYQEGSHYYYRNPYVGRVLDGYACAEGCAVNNTDKNYKIPTLTSESERETSLSGTKISMSVKSAQQLWVLSAIVNSGAGGMDSTGTYNSDAYDKGCVRTGSYDNVGSTPTGNDAADCSYLGGISYKNKAKISYLVSQYGGTYAAYVTGGSNTCQMSFASDLDMTEYGNGFRGVGATYQDNKNTDILKRTLYLGGTVGGSTENVQITLNRKVKEYSSEQGTTDSPGWWAQGMGLFPVANFADETTIQYLTIGGTLNISYYEDASSTTEDKDYIGETSAGGFAGLTANRSGLSAERNAVNWKQVNLSKLTVTGAKYVGGLAGAIGQTNRTTSSSLLSVGSAAGSQTLTSCNYDQITLEGGYAAGGYFGVFGCEGQSSKVIIYGPCSYTDSKIGWVKDACLDMFLTNNKSSTDAVENGYSGGGGLIGFYLAQSEDSLYINCDDSGTSSSEKEMLSFQNVSIYAPRFAYNCDYGLGLITGLQKSGAVKAYYIETENCSILIDKSQSFTSRFSTENYYFGAACGVLFGYAKQSIALTHIKINDSRVVDAGFGGGVIGTSNSSVRITDLAMNHDVIYSQGAANYDGSVKLGGVIGNATSTVIVTDAAFQDVTVVSDGRTSLMVGYTRDSGNKIFTNISAKDCKIVATNNADASYYAQGDTNPSTNSKTKSLYTDHTANAAGILIGGACTNSKDMKFTNLSGLKAFNMLVQGCTLGYYTKGSSALTYTKQADNSWTFNQTLDDTTIGVYEGENTGTSYSELTGDKAFSSTQKHDIGNQGILVGGATDSSSILVVGLSVQGGSLPYEENGYENAGINNSKNNCVIYADYTGASTGSNANTNGTTHGTYTSEQSQTNNAGSYVVFNPTSGMTVYTGKNTTVLNSDGVVKNSIDTILNDATGNSTTKSYNLTYNKVSAIAEQFQSGEYARNLSTYFEASESDSSTNNYSGNLDDFPVLVIESTQSDSITKLVNSYISLLTNCDQTGSNAIGNRSITARTYQWSETNKRFEATKNENATLKVNEDGSLSIHSSSSYNHDNQKNQFTLLDVKYGTASSSAYQDESNRKDYYHLYIPVVVKRVVQVDFGVKMLTGSSTYSSIYPDSGAVLASYGENYTAQLTYSYTWTAAEWNNHLNGGNNMLWSYDKQVQLGTSGGNLKDSTTRFTLVDTNRYGAGDTYFTGTGTVLTKNLDSDAVLQFNDLSGYSSVPISDLLSLNVTEDSSGSLKVTGSGGVNDGIPSGSTLRIWNGTSYTYYGPKQSGDASDTKYYSVQVSDSSGKAYADTQSVTVSEVYYLTANCTKGTDVDTKLMSLGERKLTSSNSDAMSTRLKTSGTRYYTLGDFYTISNTEIGTKSENGTSVMALLTNDYIDVSVSAKVNVSEQQKDIFDQYASSASSYFRFAIHLSDESSTASIDAASVSVEHLKIGNTELTDKDYTGELIGGVYYITIQSQKGNAYANKTVSAKVRFSYEGDTEKLATQFPEQTENSNSTAGVHFSVNAAIAYSQETIDGSSMSGSASDSTKYYREKMEVASITYNAYNTVSEDGNTSQLGINGREVENKGGQSISSLGMFNATQLSSLDLADKTSAKYPTSLVCTLTLEKKTDQEDGTTKYQQVNINTYLEEITVESGGNKVSGAVKGNGTYQFTVPLTTAQILSLSTDQIEINISWFAISDEKLEEIGDVGQYANYRVTLNAYLTNSSGTALSDKVSDYLIYTNAKFYLGIISKSDLGE